MKLDRRQDEEASVPPPTNQAAGAAAPGVSVPVGTPVEAPPGRRRLRVGGLRDAGDADSRCVNVMSGGADVDRVGGGAGPRFVPRELEELFKVDVLLFLEGVIVLWGNARGVALSATHHLEGKVGV